MTGVHMLRYLIAGAVLALALTACTGTPQVTPVPTVTVTVEPTVEPTPEPTVEPVEPAAETVAAFMLRATVPGLADASDETVLNLGNQLCDTLRPEPSNDLAGFIEGFATSSGLTMTEAEEFTVTAIATLCPDLKDRFLG